VASLAERGKGNMASLNPYGAGKTVSGKTSSIYKDVESESKSGPRFISNSDTFFDEKTLKKNE